MTTSTNDPNRENSAGMAALRTGNFILAEQHFAAAAGADPNSALLWRNLAHARRELGNDVGEAVALDAAIAVDRTDFAAWLRKAQLHSRRGEDAEALAAWSGVLTMAAAFDAKPPALLAQLTDGQAHLDRLNARLDQAVDSSIAAPVAALSPAPRRRARAFLDSVAGRRKIYRNHCAGLYYPFLPTDEFFDDEHFPWFDNLALSTDAIRDELLALVGDPGDALRPYVRLDSGSPDNIWTSLDHSLDWGACFLWEYGAPNHAVLGRCPATAAALAAVPQAVIPGRTPSAFFSILKPHTRIPPHTGVSNTRAIVHLPLVVPPGCGFRVGGETREWQTGRPFAFDDTIEHEAWNDSGELRAILIFDVWNPHLSIGEQDIIARYYTAADSSGLNPERRSA